MPAQQPADLPAKNPEYVTTPIYYLNGAPHLGHAYTSIITDFMARFWRLAGHSTFFLTGTDEHGQKIAEAAESSGCTPKDQVDRLSQLFRDMTTNVNASADDFIRTTEPRHVKGAQHFWRTLEDAGWIYKDVYKGWYAVRDEAFYKESDIKDGLAPTGAPVTWVEEPCFFFRLSAMQKPLLDFYAKNPDFVRPKERFNEAIAWVKQGLNDLAISRSTFSWGVPVPGQPDHVMYVWIDALTNYITALGYPEDTHKMQTFWPHARHVLGKDILRFHAIYWPAFLMAAKLPLPKTLYVHGWWLVEGQKMSKSLGNVLDPQEIINTYGLDVFRYFVLRQLPLGGDGDFAQQAITGRLNADLANDLGNLFQRVLSFVQKQGGAVPNLDFAAGRAAFKALYPQGLTWRSELAEKLTPLVDAGQTTRYVQHVMQGAVLGNQFMDTLAPWTLAKSDDPADKDKLAQGLWVLLDILLHLAVYLQPVMPETAAKMLAQLGLSSGDMSFEKVGHGLKAGTVLPKPTPLFQRWDPAVQSAKKA